MIILYIVCQRVTLADVTRWPRHHLVALRPLPVGASGLRAECRNLLSGRATTAGLRLNRGTLVTVAADWVRVTVAATLARTH